MIALAIKAAIGFAIGQFLLGLAIFIIAVLIAVGVAVFSK